MKKAHRFILSLFFIIIISVPGYWLIRGKPDNQVSIVEGRVLGLPERNYPTLKIAIDYIRQGRIDLAFNLVWDLYTGGSLQKKFDGAATDQFPFRMDLIKFAKSIDRWIIRLAYSLTNDNVIPADMTSDIYIMLDHDALILPPGRIDQNTYENIDIRLENYKTITSTYSEINFYIYYLESLQYSKYNPLNKYFAKADQGQSFTYFRENLTDKIQLKCMPLLSLEDYLRKFYRTDHHWNTNGILEAYDGIYEILSRKKEDFPKKLQITEMIEFENIEFLGSSARRTLYPISGDLFIGFQAEFPNCTVSDQDIVGDYNYRDEYLNGEIPTTPYIDHYKYYFGRQSGVLEYDC